jgi:Na+:H+ antiporter, NhaA family
VIDDLGAIVLIAIFYSGHIAWQGLVLVGVGIAVVVLLQRLGVRASLAYVVPGGVIWLGLLRAGIHPTLAGVILGFLTPVRPWYGAEGFVAVARQALDAVKAGTDVHDLAAPLSAIHEAHREALSPVVRLESLLHPWVAFGIMPLFALANAGVDLRGISPSTPGASLVFLGATAGLVVGKPVGIVLFSVIFSRLGLVTLPRGIGFGGLLLVGCVAGIGFTMAIFVAGLAFPEGPLLLVAKLGVLVGSVVSATLGAVVGKTVLATLHPDVASQSVDDAEASTEY